MTRQEYMCIHSQYFSPHICKLYIIYASVPDDRYVYIKIVRDMYGTKNSTIILYNQLVHYMHNYSYYPIPFTMVPWAHHTRHKKFYLCVDDFVENIFTRTKPIVYYPLLKNIT